MDSTGPKISSRAMSMPLCTWANTVGRTKWPLVRPSGPGYLAQWPQPRQVADLQQHRCIRNRLPDGGLCPWQLFAQGQPVEIGVLGNQVFDALHLMREAALCGLGLAQLAHWYVADNIARGTLVAVLGVHAPRLPGLCLYYAGHRHVPAALRALVDLVHEVCAVRAA